jgi:hypothetical protein
MAKYLGNRPTAVPLTSADIEDGVISAADLGANSVDSSELVNGSVDLGHLSASGTASSSTFLRGDNSWAAAGGGKVLQAVTTVETANQTTTSTSYVQFGATLDITPSATSSKVLVLVSDNTIYHETSGGFNLTVYRDATDLGHYLYGYIYGYVNTHSTFSPIILDSPSTTSAVTYAVYGKVTSGTLYLNNANAHSNMTLLEIGA